MVNADLRGREGPVNGSERYRHVVCDVTKELDVATAVAFVLNEFGGLDVLLNNAGAGGAVAQIVDITIDDWEAVMALNIRAATFAIKHAAPALRARGGGTIINTSSIAALRPGVATAAYSIAKAATNQLTLMAASELASHNIRVNAICPGIIPAGAVGNQLGFSSETTARVLPEISEIFKSAQPLGRAGTAKDIANVMLFLASDASSWITGQIIAVDGGMMLKGPNTLDASLPGNVLVQLAMLRDRELAGGTL